VLSYLVDLSLCIRINVQHLQTQKLVTVIVVVVLLLLPPPPHVLLQFLALCCHHGDCILAVDVVLVSLCPDKFVSVTFALLAAGN